MLEFIFKVYINIIHVEFSGESVRGVPFATGSLSFSPLSLLFSFSLSPFPYIQLEN